MNRSITLRPRHLWAGLTTLALSGAAMADGDAFAAAVTDATTKIGAYGAALIGLAAVGVAFMIGVKYVKKIRGAA